MVELVEAEEPELQHLVAAEQQKAQFTTQVHHFVDLYLDKCVEKPGSHLDAQTKNCLASCIDQFIDTTLTITSRFAQIVQKRSQ
ncbi:mitochondrial import inner membrane translocase subunit Tim8 B-like [Dromiciops gliroides]|uniref:mitochondrial import inner membrane translocase subunit Tim8 B-like n=1 Tax=Dromiciops gliroides TaxID=33562 RepID=UPI001CC33BF9|nr:mitochondrial import inner membrane translocase subunit Tim8 B-like [Dromiciops gliroides]